MNKSDLFIVTVLMLFLMLCGSSTLIIYDSGKVFKSFVENESLAYTYSALIVVSIAFIILIKGLPRRTQFFAFVLVFLLECVMLWASAIGFSSPLFDHELTVKNEKLLAVYQAQYASNEKSIRGLEKVAADFGKRNPVNLSRTQKELAKIQAKNAEIQGKIEAVLKSAGKNESGLAKHKQSNAVIFRIGCGLIQLILLSIMRSICPIDISRFKKQSQDEKQIVPCGTFESCGTIESSGTKLSDKEYVLKHIEAECKGRKGGIYNVVDCSGNVLGTARNGQHAWTKARRNLERKVA